MGVLGLPGLLLALDPALLLAAWEVALLAGHDAAGMDEVEEQQRNQHGQRVEAVHEHFVVGDGALQATRVLDQAEDDTDLGSECTSVRFLDLGWGWLTVMSTRTAYTTYRSLSASASRLTNDSLASSCWKRKAKYAKNNRKVSWMPI